MSFNSLPIFNRVPQHLDAAVQEMITALEKEIKRSILSVHWSISDAKSLLLLLSAQQDLLNRYEGAGQITETPNSLTIHFNRK